MHYTSEGVIAISEPLPFFYCLGTLAVQLSTQRKLIATEIFRCTENYSNWLFSRWISHNSKLKTQVIQQPWQPQPFANLGIWIKKTNNPDPNCICSLIICNFMRVLSCPFHAEKLGWETEQSCIDRTVAEDGGHSCLWFISSSSQKVYPHFRGAEWSQTAIDSPYSKMDGFV